MDVSIMIKVFNMSPMQNKLSTTNMCCWEGRDIQNIYFVDKICYDKL